MESGVIPEWEEPDLQSFHIVVAGEINKCSFMLVHPLPSTNFVSVMEIRVVQWFIIPVLLVKY